MFLFYLLLSFSFFYNSYASIISYKIDDSIVFPERIKTAIDYFQLHTNWEFSETETDIEEDYITFMGSETKCSAQLGEIINGSLNIGKKVYLSEKCSIPNIIHEISHILGLPHQQQYPNRNEYVLVNSNNILQGYEFNFEKYTFQNKQFLLKYPYDYDSLMHYSQYAFSKNGKRTINIENFSLVRCGIGISFELSEIDILKLNDLCNYKDKICPNKTIPKPKYTQLCGGYYSNTKYYDIYGNYQDNKQIWGDNRIRYRFSLIMKNRWEIYEKWYVGGIYIYDIVKAHSYDNKLWHVDNKIDGSIGFLSEIKKSYGIHITEIIVYIIAFFIFFTLVYFIKKLIFIILFIITIWMSLKFTLY